MRKAGWTYSRVCVAVVRRTTPLHVSTTLAGEYVSLRETTDDEWTIAFGPLMLRVVSQATLAYHEALAWTPAT